MRIHSLAMMAFLTVALSSGCGSAREVRSSSNQANAWGCDQCHGYPPPPFFSAERAAQGHPKDVTAPTCSVCHPTTVMPDGHTLVAGGDHMGPGTHAIDYKTQACDSCHGLPPATGRHVFHVVSRGVACSTCHAGYDPTTRTADETGGPWAVHMNGVPNVKLQSGYVVQAADNEDKSWPDAECADCHSHLAD